MLDTLKNRQQDKPVPPFVPQAGAAAPKKRVATPEEFYGGMAPPKPSPPKPARPKGLICPNHTCQSRRLEVVRTVTLDGSIMRERKCLACGQRIKTTEKE